MARIRYSALLESIRGSIGGTTFQRNAYGYTVKTKPNAVIPNSITQNLRKSQFSTANQAWRLISQAARDAWNTYANTFPIPSRNNPDSFLNGLNAFTRWHGARFISAFQILAIPGGPQGTVVLNSVTLTLDVAELNIAINASTTQGPWLVQAYLSRPLSPTQKFVKSVTRFMRAMSPSQWVLTDLASDYINVFGELPLVGDLIAIRMTWINQTNGQVFFEAPLIITVL